MPMKACTSRITETLGVHQQRAQVFLCLCHFRPRTHFLGQMPKSGVAW